VPLSKNGIGKPARYTFVAAPEGDDYKGPISFDHGHLLDKDQSEDMLMKMKPQRYFELVTMRMAEHIQK